MMKFLCLLTLASAVVCAEDITIPLGDGMVSIRDARFLRGNGYDDSLIPELSFKIINETSSSWQMLKIEFDISGSCDGQPRQWSHSVFMALGWTPEEHFAKEYKDTIIPLVGKVDGCRTEAIKANLVLAQQVDAAQATEQLRKDTAEAARQKSLAAERKKKAEKQAADAELQAIARKACVITYQTTVDKKISDLTVRDAESIKACKSAGLYSPR